MLYPVSHRALNTDTISYCCRGHTTAADAGVELSLTSSWPDACTSTLLLLLLPLNATRWARRPRIPLQLGVELRCCCWTPPCARRADGECSILPDDLGVVRCVIYVVFVTGLEAFLRAISAFLTDHHQFWFDSAVFFTCCHVRRTSVSQIHLPKKQLFLCI